MKGSKLLLLVVLFSTIHGVSQTKKASYGIGFLQNNSKLMTTQKYNPPYQAYRIISGQRIALDSTIRITRYSFINLLGFVEFETRKTCHQIGFSINPISNKDQIKYEEYFKGKQTYSDDVYYRRLNPYQLGLFLNNEVRIVRNFYGSINSQLLFKSKDNRGNNFGINLPISFGLTYKGIKNVAISFSKGINVYTDGFKNNAITSFPSHLITYKNINSISFGISYIFQNGSSQIQPLFNSKNNIQPNKTYQF